LTTLAHQENGSGSSPRIHLDQKIISNKKSATRLLVANSPLMKSVERFSDSKSNHSSDLKPKFKTIEENEI